MHVDVCLARLAISLQRPSRAMASPDYMYADVFPLSGVSSTCHSPSKTASRRRELCTPRQASMHAPVPCVELSVRKQHTTVSHPTAS
jgi:hypothetical protein